jgi:hypothetical protein
MPLDSGSRGGSSTSRVANVPMNAATPSARRWPRPMPGSLSQSSRRGCFMCYQNAWMKSREPFDGPRVKKLRDEGPPERQMLLGGVGPW